MPAYQYEAVYANGERVTGMLDAPSRDAAVAQIRQTCDVVISLTEVRTSAETAFYNRRRVDAKALALVCRQFAIILKAGLPLVQTVDLVAGQTEDKTLKRLLEQVSADVSNGWSLSYSFSQKGAKNLPVTFVETIRSGEESGDLAGAFERMSRYYERMHKTRARAASAMMYPAFVMAVAVIVVGVIMVYAIPSFTSTFDSMGIELPLVTRMLVAAADFISGYIWLLILIIAGAALLLNVYIRTEKGALKFDRFKLKIPVIGKIGVMAGASQFAHTMSTMLAAGMPILQALDVSGRSVTNHCMSGAILGTISGVESGHSLGECMSTSPDLPAMLVQMTAMGETTGSMEDTMEVLAEYYDNEVDTQTTRALSLLEPIIICVLAFFVVLILLAVYLPMFSMYEAI